MIQIHKIKIWDDETAEIKYSDIVSQPNSKEEPFTRKMSCWPNLKTHIDFQAAMEQLMPHMVIALELVDPTEAWAPDPEERRTIIRNLAPTYEVRSITLSEKKNEQLVRISGVKRLEHGQVLALNTPAITFDTEKNEYGEELREAVDDVVEEARKYLVDYKHAEALQQQLPLE